MTNVQTLTDLQRDILREVANIGAGHAATALSLMTETKIMISVPTITVVPLPELSATIVADDQPAAAIAMQMNGSMRGHTILLLPLDTAHRLAALVLRRDAVVDAGLDDLATSALAEAGNILAGAYMTALSEFLHMLLLPSPPSLLIGSARQVLQDGLGRPPHKDEIVFCVETRFMIADVAGHLPGYFLLLPDAGALDAMLAAVRIG
jgi:chemotaxis protein CheC